MPETPNLVILFSDQHRADALGVAGHPTVETPHLDRLATDGVRFERAYTTAPLCVPARTSMYMGVYPHNTHVLDHGNAWVPAEYDTFFNHLQDAGYVTAHVGKAHQKGMSASDDDVREHEDHLEAMGFDFVHETTSQWSSTGTDSPMSDYWAAEGVLDLFRDDYAKRLDEAGEYDLWEAGAFAVDWPSPLEPEDHMDGYVIRRAIDFVESYEGDDPFALYVGIPGPHEPMDPPQPFADKYDASDVPPLKPEFENGDWVPEGIDEFAASIGKRPAEFDEAEARSVRAAYYGKITHIDHWIGQFLDTLEREGYRSDTCTIYTSDHGELVGDHARYGKHCFLEESVRIPMLVDHPDMASGATSDAFVELIDLFPTALDVAAVDGDAATLGRSLLPAVETPDDPEATDREYVLSQVWELSMYRDDQYKYAINADGDGYLLFDLEEDPEETTNLIGHPDYEAVEADLRDRLFRIYHDNTVRYRREGDAFTVCCE
jgi:choline-sulfatase